MKFRLEIESWGRLADRDAAHVTLRGWLDGNTVGLFTTWVSGIDLANAGKLPGTRPQLWRAVAEELAAVVVEEARAGRVQTEWKIENTRYTTNLRMALRRMESAVRPLPDAQEAPRSQRSTFERSGLRAEPRPTRVSADLPS